MTNRPGQQGSYPDSAWEEPKRRGSMSFFVGSGLLYAAVSILLVLQNLALPGELIIAAVLAGFIPWFVLTCIAAIAFGFVGGPTQGWLGEKERTRNG